MHDLEMLEPWEFLHNLIKRRRVQAILDYLEELAPGDVARVLSRINEQDRANLLALIGPEDAADLIEELADAQAADLIEGLPPANAADIVEELESDHRADVLGEMTEDDAEAILSAMEPEEAAEARQLLGYAPDTAGGIMVTEFVQYEVNMQVADVIRDLRENAECYADYGIHYVHVCAASGRLVGVIRMRDLLLAPAESPIHKVMIANPIYVEADTKVDDLNRLFDRCPFWSLPVTDEEGHILGVVRRADVEETIAQEQERAFMRFGGIISGEELRSMPLKERTSRRLAWLALNMTLSIMAASVILFFEDTIDRVFALVFFMPVICNMCGCSGNQAVAVSIRELALGMIVPGDFMRVWMKEVAVGLITGIVLGVVLAVVANVLWQETAMLGVVIGAAFVLNTLVAVSLGGLIPLVLRAAGMDPALGAPPILTTVTDLFGHAFVLVFAAFTIWLGVLG